MLDIETSNEAAVGLSPSHSPMTAADYELERQRILSIWGDSSTEAAAQRDQALARLFDRSGWTQEQLAKAEGCGQSKIAYRLRFGRFLSFTTTVVIPKNLTERRFRGYWERTDKCGGNDRQRFIAVQKLMAAELTLSKSHRPKRELADAILAEFADGKKHKVATIAQHVAASEEDVVAVLEGMRTHGNYDTRAVRHEIADYTAYEIHKHDGRMVPVEELKRRIRPIIEELERESKKSAARYSPKAYAMCAFNLNKLIDELAK